MQLVFIPDAGVVLHPSQQQRRREVKVMQVPTTTGNIFNSPSSITRNVAIYSTGCHRHVWWLVWDRGHVRWCSWDALVRGESDIGMR